LKQVFEDGACIRAIERRREEEKEEKKKRTCVLF